MPDIYVAPKKKKKSSVGKNRKARKILGEIAGLKPQKPGLLTAFVARPTKLRFETQEKKEKIILLLRRHLVTNIGWLLVSLGLILVPPLVFKIFSFVSLSPAHSLILGLFWYLLTFAFAFEKFLSWFFNVNIITDERIIDIDFPNILYKDLSETKIDQIQDVSIKVGGFARSLFNFGDVSIQTAGTKPEIYFEAIPNPEQVSRILNELILEEEKEKIEGRVR